MFSAEKSGLSIATPPQLYSPSSRSQASVIQRSARPSQRQPFPSGKFKFIKNLMTSNREHFLNFFCCFVYFRTITTTKIFCTQCSNATTFTSISNWNTFKTISYTECNSFCWASTTTIGTSTTFRWPSASSNVHVSL